MKDKLLQNLTEVDKYLWWLYIAQILVCLFLLFLCCQDILIFEKKKVSRY